MSATAYRTLVNEYGAGRVADALLEKWLADPEADEQWDRVEASVRLGRPPSVTLTPPEARVLRLVANGCNATQAAAELGRSRQTVLSQMKTLRKRLGVVTNAQAVAVAFVRGELVSDDIRRAA